MRRVRTVGSRKATAVLVLALALGADLWLAPAHAAAGDLDPAFGTGGKVVTDLSRDGRSDEANAVALQPDGRIVVAGSAEGAAGTDAVVARYRPDGNLDSTFGTGGRVVTDLSRTGRSDQARTVLVQPDGRILVVGTAFGGGADFALARYRSDGTLDPTFGTGGRVTTDVSGGDGMAAAAALLPDGRIVVAGTVFSATGADFALARYRPDGTLDPTFGAGGTVRVDVSGTGSHDFAEAVALQPDGRIVVAGSADVHIGDGFANEAFALARFRPDGTLDPGFATGGRATTDFGLEAPTRPGSARDVAFSVALQPDGRIVAAGAAAVPPRRSFGSDSVFALARYQPDGTLDPGFGNGGKVTTAVGDADGSAAEVLVQPDGRLVAIGSAAMGDPFDERTVFALARYQPDGSLDATFGSGGTATTSLGAHSEAAAGAVQPDGRVVAAGSTTTGSTSDTALARYLGTPPPDVLGTSETGYYLAGADGGVYTFRADFHGSMGGRPLNAPVVDMATDPDGEGYWLFAADVGVFAFKAPWWGWTTRVASLNAPIVGGAAGGDNRGYYLVASHGGVFALGAGARFAGSMGGRRLRSAIVDMATDPDGSGYWLFAADGGVFAFDAPFFGSMGGKPLNSPVVGGAAAPGGQGYYLVAADGGVFAFGPGARFAGSMGGRRLNQPMAGMAADPDGEGYWTVARDGGVFSFAAPFHGSTGGMRLGGPVVGMAAAR